jgi:hypothetical protein
MLEHLFCFRIELISHLMDLILVPAIFALHSNVALHREYSKKLTGVAGKLNLPYGPLLHFFNYQFI